MQRTIIPSWLRASIKCKNLTSQNINAYKQVTKSAGNYQVAGAKKVATLNIGGTATTNVCFIVGTED